MTAGMWVGMLLWGVLLVALIALVVTTTMRMLRRGSSSRPDGGASARSVLDVTYARGELDREDYLRRRADLAGPS